MSVSGNDIIKNITSRLGKNGSHVWNYYGLAKGTAWCAAEVSYTLDKVGLKSKFYGGKPVFYVPYAQQWLHNNAKIIYELGSGSLANAQAGDIIIFTWGNKSRDHIGFCRCKGSSTSMNTIEGNTNGGKVANKSRAKKYIYGVYRLKGISDEPYDYTLTVDGEWGTATTITTQHVLGCDEDGDLGKNTIKAIQTKVGADADGEWGTNTTKAMQKFLGVEVDGVKGKQTIKAWQKWLNEQLKSSTTKTETKTETKTASKYSGEFPTFPVSVATNRKEQMAKWAESHFWGSSTAKSRYAYKTGSPTATMKSAMQKRGYDTKISYSDCGYNMNTIIYHVLGKKTITLPSNTSKSLPSIDGMTRVYRGTSISSSIATRGRIIRYRKNGGGQHTLMVLGGGLIAEGSRSNAFGHIHKSTKYLGSKKEIEVWEAIEGTTTRTWLQKGDKNSEVTKLQNFLKWYGCNIDADGDFGSATESAVKTFQTNEGLTVDGQFGAECLAKAKECEK